MEIHHLKQLLTISQCGSINRAAQKLYISQPSLNNILKRCEQELGFAVFTRTPRGVTLTEKGERFIEIAKTILAEYKKIEALSSEDKTISISCLYLSYLFEALLKAQEQGFLFSHVFRRTEPSEMLQDILCQKARIGILPIYQFDFSGFLEKLRQQHLQYRMLFETVPLYVVVNKNHSLAKKKRISVRETLLYPLAYYTGVPEQSALKTLYDSKHAIKVQNRDELFLVLRNQNYFSLFTLAGDSKNSEFCYIPVTDEEFKMKIGAVFLSDTILTEQERELLEFLKKIIHL